MKPKALLTSFTLFMACVTGCSPQGNERGQVENAPQNITLVISPSLPDRGNALGLITTFLMRQADCHIQIFDGSDGTQITEFTPSKVKYFRPGAVADRIGVPIQKLIAWRQETAGDPRLLGTGALAIPEVLARIAQSRAAPERLILIGSPIYRSPNSSTNDFTDPQLRYPSVGHLKDPHSPFSCVGRERSLAGTRVYYLFPKEDTSRWPATYEANLRQFYGALIAKRGGTLISFTPDLEAGLRLVNTDAIAPLDKMPPDSDFAVVEWHNARPWVAPTPSWPFTKEPMRAIAALTNKAEKIEASSSASRTEAKIPASNEPDFNYQASRTLNPATEPALSSTSNQVVIAEGRTSAKQDSSPLPRPEFTDEINHSPSVPTNAPPPAIRQIEPGVTIIARYKSDNAAADVYVRPHRDASEISFRQPATSLGTYDCRFDFETGEHVKSIHLPTGCDPAKSDIWINYSSGFGRLAGRIIWMTPDGQTELPFSFVTLKGDHSDYKRESYRKRSEQWQRINAFDFIINKPAQNVSEARPASDHGRTGSGQAQSNVTRSR